MRQTTRNADPATCLPRLALSPSPPSTCAPPPCRRQKSPLLILLPYLDAFCAHLPSFTLSSLTVHRFLISSACVASKAICDSFCTNSHYAKVGGIKVDELNLLERELISGLGWKLNVRPCSSPWGRRDSRASADTSTPPPAHCSARPRSSSRTTPPSSRPTRRHTRCPTRTERRRRPRRSTRRRRRRPLRRHRRHRRTCPGRRSRASRARRHDARAREGVCALSGRSSLANRGLVHLQALGAGPGESALAARDESRTRNSRPCFGGRPRLPSAHLRSWLNSRSKSGTSSGRSIHPPKTADGELAAHLHHPSFLPPFLPHTVRPPSRTPAALPPRPALAHCYALYDPATNASPPSPSSSSSSAAAQSTARPWCRPRRRTMSVRLVRCRIVGRPCGQFCGRPGERARVSVGAREG